ncbi:lipopolysaccharide biosynthesis protein [Actibacterium sp. D379-3]
MRTLGIEDLAQVSLMQTLVMLIGFVQIGLLNGAYITMAEKDAEKDRRVVDLVWTSFIFLALLVAAGVGLGFAGFRPAVVAPVTLLLGGISGAATLGSTFLNNSLVAHGQLDRANTIGLAAVLISLTLGIFSAPYGLTFALLAVLSQPLLIVVGALASTAWLRLASLRFDPGNVRDLLRVGSPMFLGSVFLLLSYQLERWAIVFGLGEAALGRFYLVIMYMNFFVLLPASILNLHFPPALRALYSDSSSAFNDHARRHLRDLLAFCVVAGLLTFFAMPWLLQIALPRFSAEAGLVFLAFPAMILFVLRDTASLVFLATKRTGAFIASSGVFFATYSAALALLISFDAFSLESLIIARGAAALVALAVALHLRARSLSEVM